METSSFQGQILTAEPGIAHSNAQESIDHYGRPFPVPGSRFTPHVLYVLFVFAANSRCVAIPLYLASLSGRMHNEQVKKYFYRKGAEGKPERVGLNKIATRLLRIICATVKSGTPFIENYRSVNPALLK